MESLRQKLQQIQDQLAGLTGTQRMLVFSLVAVMVLTVLLWSRYAATPDMVPLLSQAVSAQELPAIQNSLTAAGIRFSGSGATIMVSPDDRLRAIAAISASNALPSNSNNLLDDFFSKSSPWDSQDKTNKLYTAYRERLLAEMMRLMPGVREARVVIGDEKRQHFGGSITPTAFVSVISNGQVAARQMVAGIAAGVAGSINGIKREDIKIVIDGATYSAQPALPGGGSGELVDVQSDWDNYYARQVEKALAYIPGVQVSVSCRVDTESKETHLQHIDKVDAKESEITADTSESIQSQPGGPADPGVGANTGTALVAAQPGGGTNTTTTDKNVTKLELFPSRRDERISKQGGLGKPIAASIVVPRSWYVAQIRNADPSAKEPDPAAIEAKASAENAGILEAVQKLLGLTEGNVTVRMYNDSPMETIPGAALAGAGGLMSSVPVAGYAKEIAIGMLALVSLFMVMLMVRRSAPPPLVLPEPPKKTNAEVGPIDGNEPLIGIAATGNPTLAAMEVADDDLQSQQMVDQVNSMVKENPDAAATLVKRWLNRS